MEEFDRQQIREQQAAIYIAMHVIGWPLAIALVIDAWQTRDQSWDQAKRLVVYVVFGWFGLIIANVVGRVAHRLFSSSTISSRRMAAVIALLADITVLGWLLVNSLRYGIY